MNEIATSNRVRHPHLRWTCRLGGALILGSLLLAACGAGDGTTGASGTALLKETSPDCSNLASLVADLQPQISYDYEPSTSPAQLAARVSVVFLASAVSDVRLEDERVVLNLDAVELISDNRTGDLPNPEVIAFDVGSTYDTLPDQGQFEGISLIAFAHEWEEAPGGLVADIEGLWLGCGVDSPAVSVIVDQDHGDWPDNPTLASLRDAISAPSGPDEGASPSDSTPSTTAGELQLIVTPEPAGNLPEELMVGCSSGPTFPLSALEGIRPLAESGLSEIEAAIRVFLDDEEGQFWPQDDWQVVHQTDSTVLLAHLSQPEELVSFMTVELTGNEWRWAGAQGGGPCPLQARLPEGLNTVQWRIDPAAEPLTPNSTTVDLLVTERECASGQAMGDRLLGPEIVATQTAILIAFAAEPPPGDSQTCQGNPEQTVVVELPEPLGDRVISDGLAVGMNLEAFLTDQ